MVKGRIFQHSHCPNIKKNVESLDAVQKKVLGERRGRSSFVFEHSLNKTVSEMKILDSSK